MDPEQPSARPAGRGSGEAAADVRALWTRAVAESDRGRPLVALRWGTRALSRLLRECPDEVTLHARILLTLAYQRWQVGDIDAAADLLDRAESVDPASQPRVEANRGEFLKATHPAEAVKHFDQAIAGLRSDQTADGQEALAITLLNRGVMHMSEGRLRQAHADTEAAAAAARRSGSDVIVFMATHNLGYVDFLAGNLPGSLETMTAAREVLPTGATGVPAMDRARVLLSAGLRVEAGEFIDQAIASFAANRATTDLVEALQVRAELDLLIGDPHAARAHARRAAKIATARSNERAALVIELLERRAGALNRRGKPAAAAARRDAAGAAELADRLLAADLPDDAREARLLQAEALLDAADPAGAAEALAASATRHDGPKVRPRLAIRLHTRLVEGRIELATGRRAGALSRIRRGLDDLADFQARFGSQDLQSAAAVHGRELARLGLRTATDSGSPAAILQWLERARAVTTRLPVVRPPADPVLAEELGALRMADEQARAALLAGRRDPLAERKVAELRRKVRARSWTVSGTGRVHRPPTLTGVRRSLAERRPDAAVVALFVVRGEIHSLVITRDRAAHLVLADREAVESHRHRLQGDLDLLADDRIPERLKAVARSSLDASLGRLSDAFAPVLEIASTGPVLVAAIGPLATVPWLLLPALEGRAVAVSSSVTRAIAGLNQPVRDPVRRGVLVVAGPDVTNGDKEASGIAALHPGSTMLTGEQATGRAVLDAIPAGGLLHVAAHGHHEAGNPLFSGVKLADGLLFGYDLAPNPTLPGHVVLSSCDVGQTDDRPGGEPLGLVAALVRSGVPTVITGTSRVADAVAESTMLAYHQRLLDGEPPAEALAAAVAASTAATGLPAPFSCFGAGL
ncbi:CHAT domain-containing protein [Nakamurella sp. GG22]